MRALIHIAETIKSYGFDPINPNRGWLEGIEGQPDITCKYFDRRHGRVLSVSSGAECYLDGEKKGAS